jgi:transcriptional regulator with XRE-family HTH domain
MGELYDPICVQMGKTLRRLRCEAGWSQEQLGRQLGVTFQQVQKYESGRNQLGVVMLHRLTRIFHLDYAEFFAGVNDGQAAARSLNAADEYATLRWSRAVQGINDQRVRRS